MLSSLGTQRRRAAPVKEIGFSAYLNKPVRHRELKGVLSQALGDKRGMEESPRPIATRHTAREVLTGFAGRNARILLAEDNLTNRQVALGILNKLGLRADAVANGAEAVQALATIPYDLVLMDVQMPVMDGLEATRQIRDPKSAVTLNHRVPIVAMTAHAMQGDREMCLEAGMNDYVAKPVNSQELFEALNKLLPPETLSDGARNGDGDMGNRAGGDSATTAEPCPRPIFDRAGMLERLMDDKELMQIVANAFLTDIPRQIATLRGCLDSGDVRGSERQAHSIKGAAANVGGERLREAALDLEKAAGSGNLSKASGGMAGLEEEFDRLRRAMIQALFDTEDQWRKP